MKTCLPLLLVPILLMASLSACSPVQKGKTSTGTLEVLWKKSPTAPEAPAKKTSKTLVVFLPGVRDNKEDFLKNSMFQALTEAAPAIDMLAADLHLGYLKNGTNISHLREDIILPAKKMGYTNIWLAGVSLGGLNSLLYLKHHPQDICGLVLLSPYLGEKTISREITAIGGIRQWRPPENQQINEEQALWAWLKTAPLDNVYLGSGRQDRFFALQQQLAALLPANNVHFIQGKHRWPVWQALWKYFTVMMETEDLFEQC